MPTIFTQYLYANSVLGNISTSVPLNAQQHESISNPSNISEIDVYNLLYII